MRIKNNPQISILAERLSTYNDIENVLESQGIPCLVLCRDELYDGDDKKAFKFGHDYWGKTIVCFWDDDFNYYAVGSSRKITEILKEEIAEIHRQDQF